MTQVKVIDTTDELYGFIGVITMIGSERKIWVYFDDDVCATLVYDEDQLEVVKQMADMHIHTVEITITNSTGSITTTTKTTCNCDQGSDHTTTQNIEKK